MLEATSKNKSVGFPKDKQLDLSTQDATQPKTKGRATVNIKKVLLVQALKHIFMSQPPSMTSKLVSLKSSQLLCCEGGTKW